MRRAGFCTGAVGAGVSLCAARRQSLRRLEQPSGFPASPSPPHTSQPQPRTIHEPHLPAVARGLDNAQEVVQGVHELPLPPGHNEVIVVVQDVDHRVLHDPALLELPSDLSRPQPAAHGALRQTLDPGPAGSTPRRAFAQTGVTDANTAPATAQLSAASGLPAGTRRVPSRGAALLSISRPPAGRPPSAPSSQITPLLCLKPPSGPPAAPRPLRDGLFSRTCGPSALG